MLKLLGGPANFADYDRADNRITGETRVPYVLIRPGELKKKPGNGKYRVYQGEGTYPQPIAKEDLAAFLLDATTDDTWNGKGGCQISGQK